MSHDNAIRLQKVLGYLEIDPGNYHLLAEGADLCLVLPDWAMAGSLISRALTIQPQDNVMLYRKAVLLLGEGQPEEALGITQNLFDGGISDPAVYFQHARALNACGRFDESVSIWATLVLQNPAIPEASQHYVRTLHYLGKMAEAIAFAEHYLAEHPDSIAMQAMLSLLYSDNDDAQAAAALSAKVLEVFPKNTDALLAAGSAALAYENEAAAAAHFTATLAVAGESGRAWLGLGLSSMLSRNLPAAAEALGKAVQLIPTHLGSYNALAWVQILQGEHQLAKKTLDSALQVDRTFSETHGGLAVLAVLKGDWVKAQRLADIATRIQANSFAGNFAQSLILQHQAQPEKAQAIIENALKGFSVPGGGNLLNALQRYNSRRQS